MNIFDRERLQAPEQTGNKGAIQPIKGSARF